MIENLQVVNQNYILLFFMLTITGLAQFLGLKEQLLVWRQFFALQKLLILQKQTNNKNPHQNKKQTRQSTEKTYGNNC